ncbi:hypothetical protein F5Y18DRAFT_286030 [Xylariaceae sp. FL1019]|nr:hypothetical protein F5Y18DRAFT_286030 [Xylariaceae sp. FL1019]
MRVLSSHRLAQFTIAVYTQAYTNFGSVDREWLAWPCSPELSAITKSSRTQSLPSGLAVAVLLLTLSLHWSYVISYPTIGDSNVDDSLEPTGVIVEHKLLCIRTCRALTTGMTFQTISINSYLGCFVLSCPWLVLRALTGPGMFGTLILICGVEHSRILLENEDDEPTSNRQAPSEEP